MARRFSALRPVVRLGAVASLSALSLACGDAEPELPEGPPVVSEQVAELSTVELMGMDRDLILATLPWRSGSVRRTADANAAAGTQVGVDALTGTDFDRVVLSFRRGAPAPGYRVWSPAGEPVTLCGEEQTFEQPGVVVQLTPALAREDNGDMVLSSTSYDLNFPVVVGAELVCEADREVSWFIQTVPERVEVRMLHLMTPDRIAIDIRAAAEAEAATGTEMDEGTGSSGN